MIMKAKYAQNDKWQVLQFFCPPPKKLICPNGLARLRNRCLASIKSFRSEGEHNGTPGGDYVYRDNGANILAVAHLDTVQPQPRHFGYEKDKPDIVYNAQLDDRLGAWTILDVLPSLGIGVDVLLTEGEEYCCSTAKHFDSKKEYNWIVEFDRSGTDVVLYDYETPELVDLLEVQGNTVGRGSYSDISEMQHLGVAGFNWGVGYYNNHFPRANYKVSEYTEAIKRFVEFYKTYADTRFEHSATYYSDAGYRGNYKMSRDEEEWVLELEERQNAENAEREEDWDEQYWTMRSRERERDRWDKERWGKPPSEPEGLGESEWKDCFANEYYYE